MTMQVTIHLSGPPEDVAMATAMLSSMRNLTVEIGAKPEAAAPAAPSGTGASGAPEIDAAEMLPPVPKREPPTKLVQMWDDWLHQSACTIAVDSQHHLCVTGGTDANLEVWREEGRRFTRLFLDGSRSTTSIDYHTGLNMVVANVIVSPGKGGCYLAAWKNKEDELGYNSVGFTQRPTAAKLGIVKALSETSGFLSVETSVKKTQDILFWDLGAGSLSSDEFAALQPAQTFRGHMDVVTALVASPLAPAQTFLSGSTDATIKLWDLRGGAKSVGSVGGQSAHAGGVTCLDTSGYLLFSGGADNVIKAWDFRSTDAPLASVETTAPPTHLTANTSIRLAALCSPKGIFLLDYANEAAPVLKQAEGFDKTRVYTDVKWNEEAGMLCACSECGHVELFTVDY